ncbi:phosphotransferase family protein [Piscinibacter sakaiensis]|uniref:Putative phosphotransferase n=2 Tax=Piscinibacter sakaiensis TaxID=1547922 RepID=A0A0K8P3F3_PISS1|nr:putative phosphotransferase [Piscinibacter sakaiensis]
MEAAHARDWRDLVDPVRLAAWMDTQGLGAGAVRDAVLLTGGTQNVLVRFRRGERDYVLRRPSRHPRADSDRTMLREARLLEALAGRPVPHPGFVAACADTGVIGAAFYLMAPVDGFNPGAEGLPPLHAGDRAIRRRMGLAMVEAILALGAVDAEAAGLADFGRVDGYLERQVPRWRKQLAGYAACAGWPGEASLPQVEAVADWLDAHRPARFTPGLVHGDFHLSNVMFRHDGPELAAVIDWELATLGDPLLDLGWLLATWPGPDGSHHSPNRVQPWDGFVTADELVAHYAARSPRDMGRIGWYEVLACFKLGIVLEGTHARACAGLAPEETGRRLHHAAQAQLRRAVARIERGRP